MLGGDFLRESLHLRFFRDIHDVPRNFSHRAAEKHHSLVQSFLADICKSQRRTPCRQLLRQASAHARPGSRDDRHAFFEESHPPAFSLRTLEQTPHTHSYHSSTRLSRLPPTQWSLPLRITFAREAARRLRP